MDAPGRLAPFSAPQASLIGAADIQATVGTISGEGRNCLYRCIIISLSSAREGKFSIQELRNKLAVFVEAHPDHLSVPGDMESETFEERIRLEFKMTVQQYCIRMRRRNRPAMGGRSSCQLWCSCIRHWPSSRSCPPL